MAVHFSSEETTWETPADFFKKCDDEFHFTLDVCATAINAKVNEYYSPEEDGLANPWEGVCWMNPPYSDCAAWIAKAYHESLKGATVVCLIPARTDTRYWHEYIFPHAEVRFLKGRLRFGDAKASAPFPSALVIFRP